MKYLYPIILIAAMLISNRMVAQPNEGNDSPEVKKVALVAGPEDSLTARIFITLGCNESNPWKNAENVVADVLDELMCHTWTYSAIECDSGIVRSFQNFPSIEHIPANAIIDSAILVLKGKKRPFISNSYGNSYFPGSPYQGYGTNEIMIGRVLQSWSSATITWNNSPAITFTNHSIIPYSTSKDQYDASVDVTKLVQDMVDSSTYHGFVFKLQNESLYRAMTFYSSAATNAAHRPKLNVYYHLPGAAAVMDVNAENFSILNVYPNPATDALHLQYNSTAGHDIEIAVLNMQGQLLQSVKGGSVPGVNEFKLNISEFPQGQYMLQVSSSGTRVVKRFMKL